jgi:hypothetical protein
MLILVGDNPFHGVSHLSQERARARGRDLLNPEYAAYLVELSVKNGADGFMFSVDEATLSILRLLRGKEVAKGLRLYAITPAAYSYVRLMAPMGVDGLAKSFVKQVMISGNLKAVLMGLKGAILSDPVALLKSFLSYEISRIKSSSGKHMVLESVMLHEIITDMALALNMEWLFNSYIEFMKRLKTTPGFETRNFTYLVSKFKEWGVDLSDVAIAAPFNKMGFQMTPPRIECEKVLELLPKPNVIAISILAAGYLKLEEAIEYVKNLPNIKGVAVGVSKEKHANETFKILKEAFKE